MQTTILAVEELNAKYTERVHFVYRQNEQKEDSINPIESYILINFK
jgi:hypothetical protein